MIVIDTASERETLAFARRLGEQAKAGDVYALDGDLGAGKTVFAKGFAAGLGVPGTVSSPTFTIIQVHEGGRLPLYHMDVYRLSDEDELEAVGAEEMLRGDGVCLVEWACLVRGLLPPETTRITIEKDLARGTDFRRIRVEYGSRA
ncbi:MAG: tRNA (adenosine(37)-N6)-threonylcarbamoyltransferase complex ATPase subunit type 1 TsaE [Lachnospiraceae bacterium]|nr:tRNA (adenosine(37)-N6)-threonylcarbamoyltransferase complex ATPase subunit type 1 TsaE [Lachnospiraceae bacterium]